MVLLRENRKPPLANTTTKCAMPEVSANIAIRIGTTTITDTKENSSPTITIKKKLLLQTWPHNDFRHFKKIYNNNIIKYGKVFDMEFLIILL